jgi:hypothetical protein
MQLENYFREHRNGNACGLTAGVFLALPFTGTHMVMTRFGPRMKINLQIRYSRCCAFTGIQCYPLKLLDCEVLYRRLDNLNYVRY